MEIYTTKQIDPEKLRGEITREFPEIPSENIRYIGCDPKKDGAPTNIKIKVDSNDLLRKKIESIIENHNCETKAGYYNPKAKNFPTKIREFETKVFQEGRVFYTDKRIDKEKLAREISARLPSISPQDIGFEGDDENKIIYILSIGRIYEHEVIREVIDRHRCRNKDFSPRSKITTTEQILDSLFLEKLEIKFPGYHFLSGGDFREFGANKHIEILGDNPPIEEINKYISTLAAIPNMPQAQSKQQQGVTSMSQVSNKVAAFDNFLGEMIKEATPEVTKIVANEVVGKIEPAVKSLKQEVQNIGKTISETTLKKETQEIQESVLSINDRITKLEAENKSLKQDLIESEKRIVETIKSMQIYFPVKG